MTTSIMMHGAQSVTTSGVDYGNANAITLKIRTNEMEYEVTLFNLPEREAMRIDDALNKFSIGMSEDEIRADERRKISEKLGL